MTIVRATVPLPTDIAHIPHQEPSVETISSTVSSTGIVVSGGTDEWKSIAANWWTYRCDPEHFPVDVRYRVVAEDSRMRSRFSETSIFGTTPRYDIYVRYTATSEPDQTTSPGSTDWTLFETTTLFKTDAQMFTDVIATQRYVQFMVCGADKNFSPTNISLGSENVTGDWIPVAGPVAAHWHLRPEDNQVIGVTVPVEAYGAP